MGNNRVDLLDSISKQVIDWLKFAETKNGSLVAVGFVTIFGAFRIYASLDEPNYITLFYTLSFMLFTAAAVVLSLLSFIPRVVPPYWVKFPKKLSGDNPFFFGHICKYSKSSYLELFNKHTDIASCDSVKVELALCDQIVNNSKIAYIKYSVFNSAIYFFLAGILTPFGALLLFFIKK